MAHFRPLYLYVCALPLLIFVVHGILTDLLLWRYGLDVQEHKLYHIQIAVSSIFLLPSVFLGYLGPIDAVPFQNRLYYLCWASFGTFCTSHLMAAGGSTGEHPAHPRTSILIPFLRATRRTVQLVDAFSDLAVIKTLFEQARPVLLTTFACASTIMC